MNYYADEPEWKWLFKNAIDWDRIIPLYYPEFPTADGFNNKEEVIGFIEELLTATGDWAGNAVANRARALDENGAGTVEDGWTKPGPELQEFYKEAAELSVFGLSAPVENGGMGVPAILGLFVFEQVNRACMSSGTQLGFFTSIIDMIERFCEKEDRDRLIPKIVAGELSGSMCLTEPGAGSDLGSLKTTAKKQADGSYLLTGNKIFITNGGGGLGFVLARTDDAPEGLAGISMFLCEQEVDGKQNYQIVKSEHKMGLHGSFTCYIAYENSKAKLIGKENHGFRYMLHLMNEARCAVGLQGLAGIEGTLAYARKYAEERQQFGKNLLELPLYARNLKDWEVERDAIRALMVDTVSYFDQYAKLDLKKRHGGLDKAETKQYERAKKWTRRRTPIVKAYAAEAFTRLSTKGIQALGGYGFIEEYDAARYHRDSFAPLLYEGTTQIQALMAMKDLMKFVMRNPAKYFTALVNANPVANFFGASSEAESKFNAIQYDFKKNFVKLLIRTLKPGTDTENPGELRKFFNAKQWLKEENVMKLMIHAETILFALSYIETLRVLMEHANKDESRAQLFEDYYNLVTPRFAEIYADWSIRRSA